MANDSDGSGAEVFATIMGALLVLALIVTAVIIAVMALMSLGALFGTGTALNNYRLAFARNVKPQQVTS